MPELIVTMGAPGAGKSTWAQAYPWVVTLDDVRGADWPTRRAAFDRACRTTVDWLSAGRTVVFDSTAVSPTTRTVLYEIANRYRAQARIRYFATPVAECLARQATRAEPVPAHRVRELHAAIAGQRAGLEAEGWEVTDAG